MRERPEQKPEETWREERKSMQETIKNKQKPKTQTKKQKTTPQTYKKRMPGKEKRTNRKTRKSSQK